MTASKHRGLCHAPGMKRTVVEEAMRLVFPKLQADKE
jgi:hypothetical protein